MGVKDHNWLLQQNKNYWTLQVLGARDPQTLVNFMQTHHLEQDTAWFRTKLNGEDWYVLVHRFYTDRDIARNAISRLPATSTTGPSMGSQHGFHSKSHELICDGMSKYQ